jgi:hypothetical protein
MAEESALAILDKLKSLSLRIKESFANSFTKSAESLLVQQDKLLASQEAFSLLLPAVLVKETSLLYRKGKRQAMTELEVIEEREQDTLRQCQQDERSAAAFTAADHRIEAYKREREEEQEALVANWVADTQLQFSQLSYNDSEADDDL